MKLRVLAIAAVLALTLTGCGGADSKGDLPKLSASPSAAKKTTGTPLDRVLEAPPKAPKDVQSKAGAEAFSAYVSQMIFYTLATNDIDALFGIADKELCRTCGDVSKNIEKRPGQVQIGDEPGKVTEGRVSAKQGGFYTVSQNVDFPTGTLVNRKTGHVDDTITGITGRRMNVNLQWRRGGWVLLDYTFPKKAAA